MAFPRLLDAIHHLLLEGIEMNRHRGTLHLQGTRMARWRRKLYYQSESGRQSTLDLRRDHNLVYQVHHHPSLSLLPKRLHRRWPLPLDVDHKRFPNGRSQAQLMMCPLREIRANGCWTTKQCFPPNLHLLQHHHCLDLLRYRLFHKFLKLKNLSYQRLQSLHL